MSQTSDCLIIGGGVIGLSLAYQLARDGLRPTVIERGEFGREASWAGAGILPPASGAKALHPYEQLRATSFALHAVWAERLREETGIDNGYRRCGGLYLGRTPGETASLIAFEKTLAEESIPCERLSAEAVIALEPELGDACRAEDFRFALRLPTECQIRNPRHLKALVAACEQRGVELRSDCEAQEVVVRGGHIERVETSIGPIALDRVCFTAGAWTRLLLDRLGIETVITPIRGQMVLYRCDRPLAGHVINEGNRYLVPRDDGLLLAGSTEEEAGFDKRTTDDAIATLRGWAESIFPSLASARIEQTWAGLRPGTEDGFPYLGRLPTLENAFIAAGHFRSGLNLAPVTAVEMSRLIRGKPAEVDLSPFSVLR